MKGIAQCGFRVCLVTSGNVASNPRLVKEAGALLRAGYSVRIVCADIIPSLSGFDHEILERIGVEFVRVSFARPIWRRVGRGLMHRVARKAAGFRSQLPVSLAALAHHPLVRALTAAASNTATDLFIAHNLAALPAAATAALRYNARLGFDAEDYHCGELEQTTTNGMELRIRRSIEGRLLPYCHHLTCASPQIGKAYEADYGVTMTPILNVFPVSEAPQHPASVLPEAGVRASLYWFSQTIGPGRGLEEIVRAMGLMKIRAVLRLRGDPVRAFAGELQRLAESVGGEDLSSRIRFLPVAPPDEMVRKSSGHSIGLATELTHPVNRGLCLTNKIFTYLLAGTPVLLSRTPAQTALSHDLQVAGLLVDINNPSEVARELDHFLGSAERQDAARSAAWRLGQEKYNWDVEQRSFLKSVEATLASCRSRPRPVGI